MGARKFAVRMLKIDFKKNLLYIISITVMTMIMLNAINMSYNTNIYTGEKIYVNIDGYTPTIIENSELDNMGTPSVTAELMSKTNLFLLLCIASFYGILCNLNQLKSKGDETAFLLTNGATLGDVRSYLIVINGVSYAIGTLLGLGLGIITIPIFNIVMYKIMGITGGLFTINSEAVLITVIYIIIQFALVIAINFGYVYRKEIIELFNLQKSVTYVDNRNVKVPGECFFIIFLASIAMMFYCYSMKGGEHAVLPISVFGILGLYGVLKYYIPKIILKLKKTKLIHKNHRRIYLSNYIYSLNNSIKYFLGTIIILNYLMSRMLNNIEIKGVKETTIFTIIASIIIVSVSLMYNLLIDTEDKMVIYKQLKMLGYRREEIKKVVRKETIVFFVLGMLLTLLLNFVSIGLYINKGVLEVSTAIVIILMETLLVVILAFISNRINENAIMRELYS